MRYKISLLISVRAGVSIEDCQSPMALIYFFCQTSRVGGAEA